MRSTLSKETNEVGEHLELSEQMKTRCRQVARELQHLGDTLENRYFRQDVDENQERRPLGLNMLEIAREIFRRYVTELFARNNWIVEYFRSDSRHCSYSCQLFLIMTLEFCRAAFSIIVWSAESAVSISHENRINHARTWIWKYASKPVRRSTHFWLSVRFITERSLRAVFEKNLGLYGVRDLRVFWCVACNWQFLPVFTGVPWQR